MKLITLLTDFGMLDGYVGVLKGVIWGIAPDAQIADLTHLVQPQNVLEGALTLQRCAAFFPPGTVHLAVVDPGVGTRRRPMAARLGESFFVGPDNGLAGLLLEDARQSGAAVEAVHLTQPQFWLPVVSNVFHGRDIFAPVAAHLVNGVPLSELGEPLSDPVGIALPAPLKTSGGWAGQVIHADAFGNLATNLTRAHLPADGRVKICIAGQEIDGIVRAYGDGKPGELVALFDSAGYLSVCMVNGSAARRLKAGCDTLVEILFL